jgi:hypothetical protein
MVRFAYILLIVTGFSACRPDTVQPTVVIEGVLVANEDAQLRVYLLTDFVRSAIDKATVTMVTEEGAFAVMQQDEADRERFVLSDASFEIEAQKSYTVEVVYEEKLIWATAHIPPTIEIVQISSTTIPVNPASNGQPIFSVLWQATPSLARVLTLNEPNDANIIPFQVSSGNFANQFRLPVPGQGTTLWDTDFRYYGLHRLQIYTISQEFEEVFPDLIDKWLDPAPEGEEPYKSVRQDLIPVLVKAIQELSAKNDALEARIAALEESQP